MRKRLAKLPSPAMAVAFVALLAALTGTAVALPGSNQVTSGDIKAGAVGTSDIKNNGVRTQDIRNSTVGGGDVRNNSLTGNDVNEGSFGQVPRANAANAANSANVAGFAASSSVAGTSLKLADFVNTGQVGINDGDSVQLFTASGFSVSLYCDLDATPATSNDAEITVENVSAGGGSHLVSEDNSDPFFAEGDVEEITAAQGEGADTAEFALFGSNGAGVQGVASVTSDINGDFATDCVGRVMATLG